MSTKKAITQWAKDLLATTRSDGWRNTITELGTSRDKQSWHEVGFEVFRSEQELEDLYNSDPFAQRIVREPVDAAFRQGWDLAPPADMDPEKAKAEERLILDLLWDHQAVSDLKEALYWGRRDGKGGLLLGVDDGALTMIEPLEIERIREIRFLTPLMSLEMNPRLWDTDTRSDGFGEPLTYTVQIFSGTAAPSIEVHRSRIILTGGIPTSRKTKIANNWRDLSVLQATYRKLRDFDSSVAGIANALTDNSQAVLKIRDFVKMLATEPPATFTNRMRIMELARSLKIMPVDADKEDFDFVERTFAGVADVTRILMSALAGATTMPLTVLFGSSPAGLNATGESDIRLWYDQVQSEQRDEYTRPMEQLIYMAAVVAGATTPEAWGIRWRSLWQMTSTEKADHEKKIAETDQINIPVAEQCIIGIQGAHEGLKC